MGNVKKKLKWINLENSPYLINELRKTQKKLISKKNSKKLNIILTEFCDEFVSRLERKIKASDIESNFKEEDKVMNLLRKKGLYAAHGELMALKIKEHNKQVDEKNKQLKKEKLKTEMNANFYMKYF